MDTIRKIIHIDMDAFYASIEQRDHPELRGKPIIVGGDPNRRGVVATCSYEARRYGIHSAMASRTAYALCPHAIFVPPRFDVYRTVSTHIMRIFQDYTDLVEPLSLDEAYLDVTTNTKNQPSATLIARDIKQRILSETQLTASAGVSYNKFIAKLASDYQKPNGLTVIPPHKAAHFLEQTPIHKFHGVGRVTAARLKELNVLTGADLKRLSLEELQRLFHKHGTQLHTFAQGIDNRPVTPTRTRKSIGKETTLPEDTTDLSYLTSLLDTLAHQVSQRLQQLNLHARTITLKLKWHNFQQITRSTSLPTPIQHASDMLPILIPILQSTLSQPHSPHLNHEPKSVRLIGVTASHLISSLNQHELTILTPSLWDTPSLPSNSPITHTSP